MTRLGRDRMLEIVQPALAVQADGIHVLGFHSWGGLTRFASSEIHQNTWREDVEIRVMAVLAGGRTGVASTHAANGEAVRKAAQDAVAIARVCPPSPAFPGLAEPQEIPGKDGYDEETAQAGPSDRAAVVRRLLAGLAGDMAGAGFSETVADEVLVANSNGVSAYAATTRAGVSLMAIAPDSTGISEVLTRRVGDLDLERIASRAIGKAEHGRDPQPLAPGSYTVVLEPAASSTLMQFLAWIGFGAKAFLEDRSFLSDRMGERVCSELVTIVDDPLAPESLGLPFDFEGTPARRIALIERGVAKSVVWDRTTAKQAGLSSTGHALPPPNPEGPFPLNLLMEPGERSLEDLIASTERGLLVTRFHYSNIVNEKETVLTGMTRDGTFLIEDGKLARPVMNLRYTQNALEALSNVEAVGDTTEISTELFFGGSRAPALKIRDFKFSSATTH